MRYQIYKNQVSLALPQMTPESANNSRKKTPLPDNSPVATYYALEPLIEHIADQLERDIHYRIGGRVCCDLGQVIRALLEVPL